MLRASFKAAFILVFKAVALALGILTCLLFLIVYAVFGLVLFYYLFVGLVALCFWLGFILVRDYRRVARYNWLENERGDSLRVDLSDSETALKVCLFYRNGATYEDIKRSSGFSDNKQVQREIRKGLDILLREHVAKASS